MPEGTTVTLYPRQTKPNDDAHVLVPVGEMHDLIPDIPSGYDWFVLAPAHIANGAALNNAMRETNSTTDGLRAARIIDDLYNALVAGS
jgi:hypothetical protein